MAPRPRRREALSGLCVHYSVHDLRPACRILPAHRARVSCHAEGGVCPDYRGQDSPATVVNVKTDRCDVLIDRTTIFGNPFPEWQWGREGCIRRHRHYFYERLHRDPAFRAAVLSLRGCRLGCHCAPLPCHGDTIAEFLNTQPELERVLGRPLFAGDR